MLYNNDFEVLINSNTLSSWHWYQLILSHVSWGFSWFFVYWAILGWSWIYEYCVMRLWVLFKSCGECCHLAVASARPIWAQILDPCQPSAGLRISCVFQAVMMLFSSAVCPQHGSAFSPEARCSEATVCRSGLYLHMLSSGLIPGACLPRFMGLFSWASPAPLSPRPFPVPEASFFGFSSWKEGPYFSCSATLFLGLISHP